MFRLIGGLLKKRVKDYGFRKDIEALQVLDVYEEKVSDIFKQESKKLLLNRAVFFKDKIIYVKVSNSSIAQELHLQKQRIIEEINKELKEKVVKDIIFKT